MAGIPTSHSGGEKTIGRRWNAVIAIIVWSQAITVSSFFLNNEENASKLKMSPAYVGDEWNSTVRHLDGTKIILEEGSHIRLNCTILSQPKNSQCNSSNIFFIRHNKKVDANFVTIISKETVVMDLPDAGFNESKKFYCRLQHCEEDGASDTFQVSIGTLPIKPNLSRCVIEKWNSMNCTWGPSQKLQHNHANIGLTNSSFQWRSQDSGQRSWDACQDLVHDSNSDFLESCKVDLSNKTHLFGKIIDTFISAGNALGMVRSEHTPIDLRQIVIPTPVIRVAFDVRIGALSWASTVPNYYRENVPSVTPVYTVRGNYSLKSQAHSNLPMAKPKPMTNIVTTNETIMVAWRPYAIYNISVVCQVTPNGPVSDTTNIQFTTKPDVPTHNPVLSEAVFQIVAPKDLHRSVILYWKPLVPDDHNGYDFYYRVLVRPSNYNVNQPVQYLNTNSSFQELNILVNETYSITVNACNVIGCVTEDIVQTVYIPTADKGLRCPYLVIIGHDLSQCRTDIQCNLRIKTIKRDCQRCTLTFLSTCPEVIAPVENLVVEGDGSTVHLQWGNVGGAKSYTVYWCNGHNQEKICKGRMEWKDVPSQVNEVTLDLKENYKHLMFGISVKNVDNVSSVGKMADCYYYLKGVPEPPSDFRVSFTNLKYGEAYLSWSVAPCVERVGNGHIQGFKVSYCQYEQENEQCSGEVLSLLVPNTDEKVLLQNLEEGKFYKFGVQSQSRTGLSLHSQQVVEFIPEDWKSVGAWVGISLAGLIGCLLAVIGALVACRSCNLGWKKFASGLQITVPEQNRLPLPSTSSDTPFLTSFPNTPSPTSATPSLDSGRFSYTRDEETTSIMTPYSNLASKNHVFRDFNHSGVSSRPHLISIEENSDLETDEVFEEQKSGYLQTYSLSPQSQSHSIAQPNSKSAGSSVNSPCSPYMQVLPSQYSVPRSSNVLTTDNGYNPPNPYLTNEQLVQMPYLSQPTNSGLQYIDPSQLVTSNPQSDAIVATSKPHANDDFDTSQPAKLAENCVQYTNLNPHSSPGGSTPCEASNYCRMSGSGQSDHSDSDYVKRTIDQPSHMLSQLPPGGYVGHDLLESDLCGLEDSHPPYISTNNPSSNPNDLQSHPFQKEPFLPVKAEVNNPCHLPVPLFTCPPEPCLNTDLPPSNYVLLPTEDSESPSNQKTEAKLCAPDNGKFVNGYPPMPSSSSGYVPLPLVSQTLNHSPAKRNYITKENLEQDDMLWDIPEAESAKNNNNQSKSYYDQHAPVQNDGYVQHPNLWTSAF